jgi:hypothetical protein
VLNIQYGGRPSILHRDYITKKISVSGINISLWVIELPEKKGSYSAVFERVEGKMLCLIFNLKAGTIISRSTLDVTFDMGRQSYREIALQKIFQSWA